jgi:hypothetical protein
MCRKGDQRKARNWWCKCVDYLTRLQRNAVHCNETLERSAVSCATTAIEASPFSPLLCFRQSPLACVSQPKRSSLANLITVTVRVSKVAR